MRKIKFVIVLSVVGIVAMGISSCSTSRGETAVTQSPIPTQTVAMEETEEPSVQMTQTPTTGQTKAKGKLTKSTYENEFIDLRFKLPKGFVMASEEQIKSLLRSQGSEAADAYERAEESYEMLAYEEKTGVNAIVFTIEEPNAGISCAQYFKQVTEQFATQNKLVNVLDGIKEVTQWGHEYTTMDLELKINGVNCVERYCCRKINNLFLCVILASKETGNFDKMMQAFSKYGKAATETPEGAAKPEGTIIPEESSEPYSKEGYVRGTLTAQTYESKDLDIKFNVPEGYHMDVEDIRTANKQQEEKYKQQKENNRQ